MKIQSGLFDHMVLQRGKGNASEARFEGTTDGANGPVTATVRKSGRILTRFDNVKVGRAGRGRVTGCLTGVPAGGPYSIELRAGGESVLVKDVLVGDVWLLGGQSNMQGCGLMSKGSRLPLDTQVRAFYMDDEWRPARDPIHNMWACVDQVHIDYCGGIRPPKPPADWGVCPGPSFGLEMKRLTGGVPQGLIACAHGGTSMAQWDPKLKSLGSKSLYGALVRRLHKNGSKVAGMAWYQGCSDANPQAAKEYTGRMKELMRALRRDCGSPALPIALVQISRVVGWPAETAAPWNSIQEQQRRLPSVISHCTVVPAIDLALDDGIHISGHDQVRLGRRLAQAMHVIRGGRKDTLPRGGLPPVDFASAKIASSRPGAAEVVVRFRNLAGALTSGGCRPVGFSIVGQGTSSCAFDTVLRGKEVVVRAGIPLENLREMSLHYGYGTDPVCNVTDVGGWPLPVFGPVPLGTPRAITPYVRTLRVSAFQPSAGKLDGLECPAETAALGLATRTFGWDFCDVHVEIGAKGESDNVIYFACKLECPCDMKLAVLLGYDGPVRAWVDGEPLLHDPTGVNPAIPSKNIAKWNAAKGEHELLVALGTNSGRAWGIFLRFERLDVPAGILKQGPAHYEMPRILG